MRILIVDDEKIIRGAIADEIEKMGLFSQVDTASNGAEALELALRQPYDAMLLDIMMPHMDGLAFLAALQARDPLGYDKPVKVILSGYDDFAFAQKALQQGVDDFLLKPMRGKDIRALAERLHAMADKRRGAEESVLAAQHLHRLQEASLRQLFWKSLLAGEEEETAVEIRCRELDIPTANKQYRVYLFHILPEARELQRPAELLNSAFTPYSPDRGSLVPMAAGTCALVLIRELSEEWESVETLRAMIRETETRWVCSAGCAVHSLSELHKSYKEAQFLLAYTLSRGGKELMADGLAPLPEAPASLALHDLFQMQTWLRLGDRENIEAFLQRSFEQIRQHPELQRPDSLRLFASGIHFVCVSVLRERATANREEAYLATWEQLPQPKSAFFQLSAFEEEVRRMLEAALAYCSATAPSGSAALAEQAKSIVAESYMCELSSGEVAERLGLSRNYFGQLFKRCEGMSFSEFLTKVRMGKAAELLVTTNMKVYEVSEAVGVPDAYYFSQLFKKHYGISPRSYREGKR